MSDPTLLTFKCICNFIKDVNDSFGKHQKSLLLYAALIEKTGIIHEEPIKKHIACFHDFVHKNEDAIMQKNVGAFQDYRIQYSEKVFIDMKDVFMRADKDETEVIWKHLITLLAVLEPSSQAKRMLKEEQEKKQKRGDTANEEQFLTNIIDKVSNQIEPGTQNPADMMTNLMSSGVFTDLVENMNQGLTNGELDLGKMIGSLQNMIGSLNTMVNTSQGGNGP